MNILDKRPNVKAWILSHVEISEDWDYLEIDDKYIEGDTIYCSFVLSENKGDFKNDVIRSVVSSEYRDGSFAENRPDTDWFNDQLEKITSLANDKLDNYTGDSVKNQLKKEIASSIRYEMSGSGSFAYDDLTEDDLNEIYEMDIVINFDYINSIEIDENDVLDYHETIQEGNKRGQLEPWMIKLIDFKELETYEYDNRFKIEVDFEGLEAKVYVSSLGKWPLNLLSMSNPRDEVFYDQTRSNSWNRFVNPDASSGEVFGLAESIAEEANENFVNEYYDDLPMREIRNDIHEIITDALDDNNDDFNDEGESIFKDEIFLDEVEKVEVYVYDIEHFIPVDVDNLIEWRDEYIDSGEFKNYEDCE